MDVGSHRLALVAVHDNRADPAHFVALAPALHPDPPDVAPPPVGPDLAVGDGAALLLREDAAADDLELTIDYGVLGADVVADIEGEPVQLIETLADRIARTCLRRPAVLAVEVTVHKPEAPMPVEVADVAVTLTRSRS